MSNPITDTRSANRNYPVPVSTNYLSDDVGRIGAAIAAIDADVTATLSDPLAVLTGSGLFPALDYRFGASDCIPRGQFSRLSGGYRTLASGLLQYVPAGVPRIDHNPVTGGLLGALFEESRTNLLVYTLDLTAGGWSVGSNASFQGSTTAPDGTQTARICRMSSWGNAYFFQNVTFVANTTYTVSGWFKLIAGTPASGEMLMYNNSPNPSVPYTALTSTWQRFSQTFTTGSASSLATNLVALADMGANGNVDVAVWGLQLEIGSYATSFTPTPTNVTSTRATDSLVILTSAFDFNPNEGTLFVDTFIPAGYSNQTNSTFSGLMTFDDGSNNNTIALFLNSYGSVGLQIGGGNSYPQAVTSPLGLSIGSSLRTAATYTPTGITVTANGSTLSTATRSNAFTGLSNLRIGSWQTNSAPFTGPIRRAAYFPRAISAALLQRITS